MTTDAAKQLLEQAFSARREDRPEDALRFAREAAVLSRTAGEPRLLINALKAHGQMERDLEHSEAALQLYQEAVDICRAEADTLLLAHTVRHVGDIHYEMGHVALAEPCLREALALYRRHAQPPVLDVANAILPLAILEHGEGRAEEAARLWQEAKALYAEANVTDGVAEYEARFALPD